MTNQRLRVIISLCLSYFTFAILLNSVGTVIMQVINNYGVSKPAASILEGFKDIPIAIISFLVASSLPRFGLRKAMIVAMAVVTCACLTMPLVPSFLMTKLLFLSVGASFALIKVSVYASVGLVSDDSKHHAGLLNTIEGIFMIGVLSGYWIFSFFIDSADPTSKSWLSVYWVLAAICAANGLLLAFTPLDESQAREENTSVRESFLEMLKLITLPLVYVFIMSAFLYVLVEQGIGTWLPTFNNEILKLPSAMSVQATSIFAACLAAGRLSAGVVMSRVSWYPVLNICLVAMAVLIVLTLPLAQGITENPDISWLNAPIAAYIFPLIGLFMAPIYPAINSVMLSTLPKYRHAAMTGLIVIFSALGGTTGSMITGFVFEHFDGQTAFYTALIPIAGILITLRLFRLAIRKHENKIAEEADGQLAGSVC